MYLAYEYNKKRYILALLLGSSGALALLLLPLLINGILPDFPLQWLDQIQIYTQKTIEAGDSSMLFSLYPAHWFYPFNLPVVHPADIGHFTLLHLLIIALALFLIPERRKLLALFLFFGAGLANYYSQGRGFAYHLFLGLYAMILISALVLAALPRVLQAGNNSSLWQKTIMFCLALVLVYSFLRQQDLSIKAYRGTGLEMRHPPKRPYDFQTVHFIRDLSSQIRLHREEATSQALQNTRVSISVFEDHSVAIAAVVPQRLRYIGPFPVEYNLWLSQDKRARDRQRLMGALQSDPPDIMAFAAGMPGDTWHQNQLQGFEELHQFLDSRYVLYKTVHEFDGRQYRIYLHRRNALLLDAF